MNLARRFLTNRIYRFFTAVIITWAIFITGSVMLLMWACMPENNTLFVLAVAAWIWVGIIIFYSQYRTVSRYIYPLERIDKYAGKVASGKFPQPLTTANTGAECYGELIQALNQMRDKLRYLNNHCIQLQQKKQENIREMNRVNGLYTRFMAMLAADIHKPINAVRGYAWLAEKYPIPEKQQKFFDGLKHNLEETELLLSHMTKVSMLGDSDRDKEQETFEAAPFIHLFLDRGREILGERNITLSARFASDLPHEICTNREWLFKITLVLMHVIRVNATPGSNAEFSCSHSGNDVIFKMRIFSRDHHNTLSLAELYAGYGMEDSSAVMERDMLALLFIGNQAHSMNAEFSISDFGSNGTEFMLELHDVAGNLNRRNSPHVRMASQEKHRPVLSAEGTPPKKMLLADSDSEMEKIISALLPETEITFFAGAELLPEDLALAEFDVLVLEIDQFRKAQQKKAENIIRVAGRANLPVIVVLTAPDRELEQHFRNYGVAGVLSKVMDFDEFSALVCSLNGRQS